MQGAGDQLLARAALSADQDAGLRARGLLDDSEEPPHAQILRPQAMEELFFAARVHVAGRQVHGPARAPVSLHERRGSHPQELGLLSAREPPEGEDGLFLGAERQAELLLLSGEALVEPLPRRQMLLHEGPRLRSQGEHTALCIHQDGGTGDRLERSQGVRCFMERYSRILQRRRRGSLGAWPRGVAWHAPCSIEVAEDKLEEDLEKELP